MKIKYLLLLLNSFYCFSQVVPTKLEATKKDLSFPTNPTMYDFTKYGDVPLNEYRGIANINIPLYNLSLDGVEIPLTLSYYSGGIKVAEEAGIVGLGWSLNLPTIIQNIKDEDDLKSSTKFQTLPGSTGGTVLPSVGGLNPDYWSPSYFSATSIIAPSCDPGASVGYNNLPQYFVSSGYFLIDKDGNYPCGSEFSEMTYNYVDTEPDVFSVNINGDNLIIIRDDIGLNTPGAIDNVTLPLKVINGHSGYKVDRTAEGIKITDYKGNQYFFGAVDSITSTVSSNGFLQGSDPANTIVSKIHRLSKIITHKNKEILFSYFNDTVKDLEKKSYVYYKNISTSTTSFQSGGSYNSAPEDVEGINQQTFNTNQASLNSFTTEKQTQTYSFLSSITTSEETVSLSYSNRIDYEGMRKLDNISVYNNKGDVVKAIDFGYTYFGNVSDYLNKRLKLNSVTFNSDTSYQFEYNSTELPAKDSFSIDYWGYYNGKPNTSFLPNLSHLGFPNYNDNSQNDFNSYLSSCKAGSLERIFYPTGGYTEFEYELHSFDDLVLHSNMNNYTPLITSGGGLRVKSTKSFSSSGNLFKQVDYEYYNGKVIFKKRLARQITGVKSVQSVGLNTPSVNVYKYNTTLIEANLSNGNLGKTFIDEMDDYIGYDRVVIKEHGNMENIGKTEKEFVNVPYNLIFPYQKLSFRPSFYRDRDYIPNGTLKSEKVYNSVNQLKEEKQFYYSLRTSNIQRYGVNFSFFAQTYFFMPHTTSTGDQEFIHPRFLLTSYPIFANTYLLSQENSTQYLPSGNKELKTYYSYNSNNIPTGKTINDANGSTIYSESTNMMSTTDLINKNILDLPLSTSISENGSVKKHFNYVYQEVNTVTLPSTIEELPGGNPDPSKKINTFYDLYDDKSNLIQFHRENDIYTSVIWGYNKTLIVAKIENAQYSQIQSSLIQAVQSASDTGTEAQLQIALDNLRNSLPDAMVTTYTHKPLVGISCITDSKGDKIMYYYDTNNRLEYVKDKDGNILNEYEYHYRPQN